MSENLESQAPKLVRRSGDRIHVMHDTGRKDERGFAIYAGQQEEEVLLYNDDRTPKLNPETGQQETKKGIPEKPVRPDHLSDEYQALLAEELANDPGRMKFMEETLERAKAFNAMPPSEAQSQEPQPEIAPEAAERREELVEELAEPMGEAAVDEVEAEAGLPTEPFEEAPEEPSEPEEAAKAETPAQAMRKRFEDNVAKGESVEEQEALLPHEDVELLHRLVSHIQTMTEGYGDPRTAEETEYHVKRFIGSTVADMGERLRAGTLSAEAYAVAMGSLLGASSESRVLQDIAQEMFNSGQFTQEDMGIIDDQFFAMDKIGSMRGEEADHRRGSLIFDLEQLAYNVYSRNDNKPNELYMVLSGMVAGVSTQFRDQDYRWSYAAKSHGVLEHLKNLKK